MAPCGSELARDSGLSVPSILDVPPLSRASPLPQVIVSPVVLDIGQDDTRLVARLAGDTHLLLEIGAPNWTWCCAFAPMP